MNYLLKEEKIIPIQRLRLLGDKWEDTMHTNALIFATKILKIIIFIVVEITQ